MDDMSIYQKPKVPCVEGLQLHHVLCDDPPALDIQNQGMGIMAVNNMFNVHNTALALVGSCHLQRLRSYSLRFMSLMTQRLDGESGLRPPSILEAQAADKQLWQIIHDLVLDQGFSLDNALHEVTHLRSDMASLLQPRAKAVSKGAAPSSMPFNPSSKGKGKSKNKSGKSLQKGGKSDSQGRPTWVTETVINNQKI